MNGSTVLDLAKSVPRLNDAVTAERATLPISVFAFKEAFTAN
jgi:hypothetical protein